MAATEYYQQKRKQDYASKFSDAEIKRVIKNFYTDAPEYVPSSALTAQAMLAYNEAIDRRWMQFDGPYHVFDHPIEEVSQ